MTISNEESKALQNATVLVRWLYAYEGFQKGHKQFSDCLKDEALQSDGKNVLMEYDHALDTAHEPSWYAAALDEINASLDHHESIETGASVAAAIQKDGLLTGSAIQCKNNGHLPFFLTKIIAYAFLYDNKSDQMSMLIRDYTKFYGIKESVKKFRQLEREPELLQLIAEHYARAEAGEHESVQRKTELMKEAFHRGFTNEKKYRGCAQCALLSMFEVTGKRYDILFQSASGLAAGMAQSGDGCCGGYTGGIMMMGTFAGRRLDRMKEEDRDRAVQLVSYRMSQALRDKFIETYGSVICAHVHREIFGRSFCLRTEAVKKEFDAAGAHETKCTTVIGIACAWTAEILYDEGQLN